jgi:hypothetical protein
MKIDDYEARPDEEWVLLEDEAAFSGLGSTIPSIEEVERLRAYIGYDAVLDAWHNLPKDQRRITVIWPKGPLLRKAIERRVAQKVRELPPGDVVNLRQAKAAARAEITGVPPGKPGAKRVYDRARLEAIMAERGCGRVTAYKYLKAEM